MKRESYADKVFIVFNSIFLCALVFIVLYPLVYVVSASISNPVLVNTGQMWLWPKEITFEGYKRVFENSDIWMGYKNTIIYTLLGVAIHLFILLPCAYAVSRRGLMGKKAIMWYFLFTMFFNGGLIPTYLLVKDLGMVNTLWAMVLPNALGVWSIIVARTFFQQNVPNELVEAAEIDGANDFYIFFKIVIPISAPIIAVMGLFHGVGLWNQYFNGLIYLNDHSKYPLQLILREILILNQMDTDMLMDSAQNLESLAEQARIADIIKYAVMIVSALPLLIIYPFLQKYFVKGVLIGSIKE
ncbi:MULTISPECIES: carbohydrate ABC transporter permease [Lederbergia]|uniref:Sugar ABC transporter permease n=2 Tax=Lederbergia TaxID=2804231 RepID=A0A178A003_9BACI|nr:MULTISPECIES: carbohydrate ABC transporter permease [Lederbergia]KRG13130.1 sugar ABC transporter permease [Virgibacillus soli]MBP1916437.1 putative aldouronate transport system permease protein [Lederbergia galactosidilytica]OAK73507.1 sugar ABC transporter permease [Lederbergia galactosidilytica]GIN59064.1 sugar ABC transporter permease [Lederbergia ruris]